MRPGRHILNVLLLFAVCTGCRTIEPLNEMQTRQIAWELLGDLQESVIGSHEDIEYKKGAGVTQLINHAPADVWKRARIRDKDDQWKIVEFRTLLGEQASIKVFVNVWTHKAEKIEKTVSGNWQL